MFETTPETKKIPSHLRPKIDLEAPYGEKKVLMHSCCAPCAGELMELMVENGIELTIYFYNPNIHPKKEYEIRKEENIRYAKKWVLLLLTAIMMYKIGLAVLKAWKMNQKEA